MRLARLILVSALVVWGWLFIALLADSRVTIRVDPSFVRSGGNFSIYCRAPRHEANRKIRIEAEFVGAREELMEGSNSPQIYVLPLRLRSCLPFIEASCRVTDNLGRDFVSRRTVEVLGCGGE